MPDSSFNKSDNDPMNLSGSDKNTNMQYEKITAYIDNELK